MPLSDRRPFVRLAVYNFVHKGEAVGPEFVRIGEKVVNRAKIGEAIDRILELRAQGFSQQEVADRLSLDRTFISRLETLGEVRKGGRIALIGFPIENKDEVEAVAREEGVDFVLLMTESERRDFVLNRSGLELFNDVMALVAEARSCDSVVLLGSDNRVRLTQALLDKEVISFVIGQSPIQDDKYIDPAELRKVLRNLR